MHRFRLTGENDGGPQASGEFKDPSCSAEGHVYTGLLEATTKGLCVNSVHAALDFKNPKGIGW